MGAPAHRVPAPIRELAAQRVLLIDSDRSASTSIPAADVGGPHAPPGTWDTGHDW